MCRNYIFRHENGNGGSEIDISKVDWKLYRERVSDWQEHYMEKQIHRLHLDLWKSCLKNV